MDCHPYPNADSPAFQAQGCQPKIAILDLRGTVVSVNQAWRSFAVANGYGAPGHGVGVNYLALCEADRGSGADYAKQAADSIRSVLAGELASVTFEYACALPGQEHWALFKARPLPRQWPQGVIVSHLDISPLKNWGQSLRQRDLRIRSQADAMPTLIAYVDMALRYQFTNEACEIWFGIPNNDLRGRTIADVFGERAYEHIRPHVDACLKGQTVECETALRLPTRGEVFVRTTFALDLDRDGHPKGLFSMVQDISRERAFASRVEHYGTHDDLTGLPNRFLFLTCLKQALSAHLNGSGTAALLILDLDNFKTVNDSFGHPFGDSLLGTIANRLAECIPENGTLARLSGDEFAIIQNDSENSNDIEAFAKRIIDRVEAPYLIDGHEVHIGVSIGIAPFGNEAIEASGLMKNADLALYRAKKEGRGRYHIFEDELQDELLVQQTLTCGLRSAIHRQQLASRFQPQISLTNHKVVAVECLTRWYHAKLGWISPEAFIPLAENSGLIVPLGFWILRQACHHASLWRRSGHDLRVAINISPLQLKQRDFLDQIEQILLETNVEPNWLEFELTETSIVETSQREAQTLQRIAAMGIHLSIDDFGSGYSSLKYLKRLPAQKIKIDQSFIQDIGVDPDDEAIVRAIIALGHRLGKRVVAEGVETEVQAAFLANEGCDEVQGFHFGRPQTAEAFSQLLNGQANGSLCR